MQRILGMCLLLSFVFCSSLVFADQGFKLEITPNDTHFKAGDTIQIKCVITNVSDVELELPFHKSFLDLELSDADGTELAKVKRRGSTSEYVVTETISLAPGKKHVYMYSSDIYEATKEIREPGSGEVKKASGVFIDLNLGSDHSVYVASNPVNIKAVYNFIWAYAWEKGLLPDDPSAKPDNEVIRDLRTLKSNMVEVNISE